MPFPNKVNRHLPPAVEGDFASTNPRQVAVAPANGWRAGKGGVQVGRFVFEQGKGVVLNTPLNVGDAPIGIAAREYLGQIQSIEGEGNLATMGIPEGRPLTIFTSCDIWVITESDTVRGEKIATDAKGKIIPVGIDGIEHEGLRVTGFKAAREGQRGDLIIITKGAFDAS